MNILIRKILITTNPFMNATSSECSRLLLSMAIECHDSVSQRNITLDTIDILEIYKHIGHNQAKAMRCYTYQIGDTLATKLSAIGNAAINYTSNSYLIGESVIPSFYELQREYSQNASQEANKHWKELIESILIVLIPFRLSQTGVAAAA